MTTFQDPPPQSRRSARQNERVDGQETQIPGPFRPVDAQQLYPPTLPPQQAEPPLTGRRARPSAQGPYESPVAEPLEYMTQAGYIASGSQGVPQPAADFYAQQQQAAALQNPVQPQAAPLQDAPYRVRDFSPEAGRRTAPPLVEPGGMQYPPMQAPQSPSDLDYRTQVEPVGYQLHAAPAPSRRAAQSGQPEPVEHMTMSRREVRQRQAEAAAVLLAGQAGYPGQQAAPPSPFQPPPPAAPLNGQAPPPSVRTAPPPQAAPRASAPPPTALTNAMAEFEALTRQAPPPGSRSDRSAMEPGIEQTAGGYIPPVGHWSRQADLDDEGQPWENTITREVGGGNVATTSSALVLPEIPRPDHFSTALDSTGEVLLTGSIDLPRNLGSIGGDSRRYDSPNVDYMFDTQDREFPATDSAPVRAIKAVSTATSARGVIHANKPAGNRMLTVLLVTASVMAVGVVALLVAGMAFNIF